MNKTTKINWRVKQKPCIRNIQSLYYDLIKEYKYRKKAGILPLLTGIKCYIREVV